MIQTNLVLNILILVFAIVFVANYVIRYSHTLSTWTEPACAKECLASYFSGPPKSIKDPVLLSTVKEKYLDPPASLPDTRPLDIYRPIWRKLVDWYRVQEHLRDIWKDQAPGVFVEVGAADGEFMSQTLMLERNYGWSGLLIEPDPRAYKILRERKRNAWTTPLCVVFGLPGPKKYWIRTLDEGLPEHFWQLLMARSKLDAETLTGDEERGTTILVKCMPLTTILLAANITSIDLLTIDTGTENDEVRIRDVLKSKVIDVKAVLIHFPTGRLFSEPYPHLENYIIDMEHSTLLVKLYFKKKHCKLISTDRCTKLNYFDVSESCSEYLCFGFLSVKTI